MTSYRGTGSKSKEAGFESPNRKAEKLKTILEWVEYGIILYLELVHEIKRENHSIHPLNENRNSLSQGNTPCGAAPSPGNYAMLFEEDWGLPNKSIL